MRTDLNLQATPGAKMMFLIKRRPASSREELLVHWFAHHMPGTIKLMGGYASKYIGTVFDADGDGGYPWDGVAQMFLDEPMATPDEPFGTVPADSFHEHVVPYSPWATREYIVMDGSEHLPVRPLTLNAPFPTTRSGFFKVSYLVKTKPEIDYEAFYDHWLNVHAPNAAETMRKVDGFRYVVGHSLDPDNAPYAGIAELYFHDPSGWHRYLETIQADGMEQWTTGEGTLALFARTELIGMP